MKQVKMIKTKTAVVIMSILLLILGLAVFYYFDKNYQKETETFPRLSVYYKDKEIGKFIVTCANWLYKGHGEAVEPINNLYTYEFPEENIVFVGNNNTDYVIKADFRYKTISHSDKFIKLSGDSNSFGAGNGDISKVLQEGSTSISYTNGFDEYIYSCKFAYKQGNVEQAIKVVSFDQTQAEYAKNYLNTSLTDTAKIEELLRNTKYGNVFNSCKVEGNNLTLEYKYHIQDEFLDDQLRMKNLILFACIPELETITYSPENKKTFYTDFDEMNENGTYQTVQEEIEKRVYTREQVNGTNLVNIENLKKFMEQI